MDDLERLTRPDGETLALKRVRGAGPTVVWIGGFRSDMEGIKALALDAAARERGWNYIRYDHFAHGASSGDWRKATVGPAPWTRLSARVSPSGRFRRSRSSMAVPLAKSFGD